MIVQNLTGWVSQGTLVLQWELMGPVVAVSVQIATDVEFTENVRTFVIPPGTYCTLDTGGAAWFYRVGGWVGDVKRGIVDWSGIYGPLYVDSKKGMVPTGASRLKVTSIQPSLDSIIFHTGLFEPYYTVIDYTHQGELGLLASM